MVDFLESCTVYGVRIDFLNDIEKEQLLEDGYEDGYDYMYGSDIEKYDIPSEAVDYDSASIDYDMINSELNSIFDDYYGYLIWAVGCKWNGATGYTIVKDKGQIFRRDYDISVYDLKKNSKHAIEWLETSHDVPTGHKAYAIGLTPRDYERLENATFEDVEKFVHKWCNL